jgi:non-heme chloroperoxidase
MPFLTTSSTPAVRLNYEDVGTGQPVVLIHCWPASLRVWDHQVAALTAAGFRCIAYDRRGFGSSEHAASGYDYDTLTADLHDLMLALDLRNAVLVGYSMGGGEVARYLSRHSSERVAKAVLLSTGLPSPLQTADNPDGVPMAVYDAVIADIERDRETFLEGFSRGFCNWSPDNAAEIDPVRTQVIRLAMQASLTATTVCVRAFGTTDFRADLRTVAIPVLVMHGAADQIVPYEGSSHKAAAMLPSSRTVLIDGAGHALAMTHADEVSAAIVTFLRE